MNEDFPAPAEMTPPNRLFLAMDTAGSEGSIAIGLQRGWEGSVQGGGEDGNRPFAKPSNGRWGTRGEILASASLLPEEEHASLLLPRVQRLLDEVEIGVGGLSGIVVGAGPGSFTGVRVGAATAKGLAWASKLPLWAFSSLEAAAAEVEEDPVRPRLVLFDARGDRVYAAAYRVSHGSMETLLAPRATTVTEVLDCLVPPGALMMGDGAVRHRALLESTGSPVLPPPAGRPNARGLLRLLFSGPGTPPLADPGRWEPDYLRASGAERMRKSRAEEKSR